MSKSNKNILGVIPARYGATRFPGKPLKPIFGRPLLQWVIEGSRTSQSLDKLVVATDNQEIAQLAQKCGVEAVMTPSELPSGSDRVWAASTEFKADVVVNIQGDEPLISAEIIDALVRPFLEDSDLEMATLARELRAEDLHNNTVAKIVVNHRQEALYFSRYGIPYSRHNAEQKISGCLKHIGLYAYKSSFLKKFCEQAPVEIEKMEGLEQLRALYLGARIKVVQVDHESWGVDTPDDVMRVEQILKARG